MNKNPIFGGVVNAECVDEALALGLRAVQHHGVPVVSRGIETLEFPGPVMTVYQQPRNRVLFDPDRDANPFFHFFESLWILAGANTVQMPRFFLERITDYSDNGETFHGAYGHRLRHWQGKDMERDQLVDTINLLRAKPDTRQAVMSIWNPSWDLGTTTKDTPCNDMVMFKVREGRLNMTVCNRSNDVIWGAYGANAVQFSMLQELVAAAIGVDVGFYTQVSDSYHVYPSNPFWQKFAVGEAPVTGHITNPYRNRSATPLFYSSEGMAHTLQHLENLNTLFEIGRPDMILQNQPGLPFVIGEVARPMLGAYLAYKAKAYDGALRWCDDIMAWDWGMACRQWIQRRQAKAGAA